MPVMDVLLLALLVAVGSILGLRMDRSLARVTAALLLVLAGDVVLFARMVEGTYVDGGPTELLWLVGICFAALAAHGAAPRPPQAAERSRVGLRLLALPLICNLASLFVLAAGWGDTLPSTAAWLAIGCVVAAIARTAVTFREVRSFHEVKQQARTDELTGLANRRALLEAAEQVLTTASARRPAALLLLDLDGFKEVNDSLGHTAGDHLLRQIGPACSPRCARASSSPGSAATSSPSCCRRPRSTRPRSAPNGCGSWSSSPSPSRTSGARRREHRCRDRAGTRGDGAGDAALRRRGDVRGEGAREGVHVYVPDPHGGTGDRLRTMEELRTAWRRDELVVHLQPQIALADERVVGVEALVRWNHPVRGLLSPADLLPAAEQAGLLRPLTDTVLELALTAAARWWRDERVPVSVNLAAANVNDLDLPTKVAAPCVGTASPRRRSRWNWSRTPSWPTRSAAARCSPSCAGSASGRRSTTTAPATARWPTCGTCRPTSSSSTAA